MGVRTIAVLVVWWLGGCDVFDCTTVETVAEYHTTSTAAVDDHVVVAMDVADVARLGAPGQLTPDELPGITGVTLVAGASTALAVGTNDLGAIDAYVVSGTRPIAGPISLPRSGAGIAAAFDGTAYQVVWVDSISDRVQAIAIREDGSIGTNLDLGIVVGASGSIRLDAQRFDRGRIAVEAASFSDPRAATTVRVAFLTNGMLANPVIDVPVEAAGMECSRSYIGAVVLPEPATRTPLLRVFSCVVDGTRIGLAYHLHPDRGPPVEVPVRLRFDGILAATEGELAVISGPGIGLFALTDASADPTADPYASRVFDAPTRFSSCGPLTCDPHWTAAGTTYFQGVDELQLTSDAGGVTAQAFDGRGSTTELGIVAIDETREVSIPCPPKN